MVLDYAAADFPPMGSVNIPDKNKAATDVLSLFLCGRWIKMSHFEVTVVHNALGALYRPGAKRASVNSANNSSGTSGTLTTMCVPQSSGSSLPHCSSSGMHLKSCLDFSLASALQSHTVWRLTVPYTRTASSTRCTPWSSHQQKLPTVGCPCQLMSL